MHLKLKGSQHLLNWVNCKQSCGRARQSTTQVLAVAFFKEQCWLMPMLMLTHFPVFGSTGWLHDHLLQKIILQLSLSASPGSLASRHPAASHLTSGTTFMFFSSQKVSSTLLHYISFEIWVVKWSIQIPKGQYRGHLVGQLTNANQEGLRKI